MQTAVHQPTYINNTVQPARTPGQWNSGWVIEPTPKSTAYAANAEIFAEGEPSGNVYRVLSGAVRVYKILSDGRRQISAFHLPGDMFGFESGEERLFSAEAIVPTRLHCVRQSGLLSQSGSAEQLREVLNVALKTLSQTREHLLLLGRKNALERVAAFLLEMAERQMNGAIVDLPMPRHDIADYLGLTLETVSRMFAELKARAVVNLPSARHVELLDTAMLQDISS